MLRYNRRYTGQTKQASQAQTVWAWSYKVRPRAYRHVCTLKADSHFSTCCVRGPLTSDLCPPSTGVLSVQLTLAGSVQFCGFSGVHALRFLPRHICCSLPKYEPTPCCLHCGSQMCNINCCGLSFLISSDTGSLSLFIISFFKPVCEVL